MKFKFGDKVVFNSRPARYIGKSMQGNALITFDTYHGGSWDQHEISYFTGNLRNRVGCFGRFNNFYWVEEHALKLLE